MKVVLYLLICMCREIVTTTPKDDVQLIKAELEELKVKTESLQRNYTLLESILQRKFQQDLNTEKAMVLEKFQVLQQDVLYVNQQFSKLRNISGTHDDRVPVLQNKLAEQDKKLLVLQTDAQSMQTRFAAYEQDYYALKNIVSGLKVDVRNPVVFKATIDDQPAVNAGDVIIFNHVDINEGNAFGASTGIFTCPQRGLFTFVAFMKNYEEAKLHFRSNGQKIDNSFDGYQNSTSISTIVKLNVGDKVWVSHDLDHYRLLYSRQNYKMTGSFVGYLMS